MLSRRVRYPGSAGSARRGSDEPPAAWATDNESVGAGYPKNNSRLIENDLPPASSRRDTNRCPFFLPFQRPSSQERPACPPARDATPHPAAPRHYPAVVVLYLAATARVRASGPRGRRPCRRKSHRSAREWHHLGLLHLRAARPEQIAQHLHQGTRGLGRAIRGPRSHARVDGVVMSRPPAHGSSSSGLPKTAAASSRPGLLEATRNAGPRDPRRRAAFSSGFQPGSGRRGR